MQRNSDENLQDDDDAKVRNKKYELQSWRSSNGPLITKREKEPPARKEGGLSPERRMKTLNLDKHMENDLVDEEGLEGDSAARLTSNRFLRFVKQNHRDSGGQTNVRSPQQLTGNEKNKVTPLTQLLLYSEDMRISKILRRLLAEKNPSTAVDLCRKLELVVRTPTNAAYICRSFELLLENMIAVLKQAPVECLDQASTILGLIGYINRTNFPTYRNYLTKAYQSSHGLVKYTMAALKTTFSCDAVNLDLSMYCDSLLVVLKDYLEHAVVAENFIAVSETIAEFSKNYKHEFAQHFTDIVDIVVGWHLEVDQPQHLKLHCSQVLQQFSVYFIKELDFTYGLLGQFLEDIESFGEDIAAETSSHKNKQRVEVRFGAFVGAFNTILKSLARRTEFVAFSTGQAIIYEALVIIVDTAKKTLTVCVPSSAETILNINDFLCLIFANCYNSVNIYDIDELIQLQVQQLEHYNDQQKTSLLYLLLCIVRQLRTQLPCSIVTTIFRVEPHNSLAAVKLTKNDRLYKLLLRIYHEVLIIKNVPLLQEAYKHITRDIDVAISTLFVAESVSDSHERSIAETTLTFYLAAISALATQTSSIIGMYALNPSILELLISSCRTANMDVWSRYATLHSAILQMLVVHCQKNHNFMPTSRLLTEQHEKSSPTCENFSAVLKFLAEILSQHKQLCEHNLEIILKWLTGLLGACRESAHLLVGNKHFVSICKSIAAAALQTPLICASCIETLLQYSKLNEEILQCFRDVAILLLDCFEPQVQQIYTVIYGKIPMRVSLAQSREQMQAIMEHRQQLRQLQQWYKATANFAHFRNKYFNLFLHRMSAASSSTTEQSFLSIFNKCWTVQTRVDAVEYQQFVPDSLQLLSLWLEFEAARYCVRNKLRTAVGKPQDTFLAIEAIIMKYARQLTVKESQLEEKPLPDASLERLLLTQRNIRTLLSFVEELEKLIYNAAEGTAFAILPPGKPARTFFRINSHTCQEWYKRISSGINLIALHSMEYEMVIRFSENMLKANKLTEPRIEHTITSLVWALLSCEEANTLRGLYVWLRAKSGRRYAWIQHAAEHAAGRREQAAEGYFAVLNDDGAKMDSYTRDFLTDQLLDCLYSTGQWSKMREYLHAHKTTQLVDAARLYNARSAAHLHVIDTLCFGQNESDNEAAKMNEALLSLTEWNIHENGEGGRAENGAKIAQSTCNFSYYNILRTLEDAFIANTFKGDEILITQHMQAAIQMGLQESWRHGCVLKHNSQQTDFIILNHIAQKLAVGKVDAAVSSTTATLDCTESVEQSNVLLKSLLWTLLFEEHLHGNSSGAYSAHHRLYLDVAASARSEGNANLCRSMLQRFFALKGFAEPLLVISERLQNDAYIIDMEDTDLLRGFSEVTKCMYASPRNNQLDAINLGCAYCYQIIEHLKLCEQPQYPDTSANMLLTLADWLVQRGSANTAGPLGSNISTNITINSVQLQRLLDNLPELPVQIKDDNSVAIPVVERAVGKLLNGSIYQKNDSGEAWCAFGNWCYRWGKKVVEARNTDSFSSRSNISHHDLVNIKDILGEVVSEDAIKQLVNVLNSHPLNVSDGMEDLETSEDNSSTTEVLEHELRKLEMFAHKSKETIADIIGVWRQTHKNVYAYYELATRAYFKYLAIETTHTEHKHAHAVEDSTFVTTTLRILRLIVKHAIGLQEVLEEGLNTTPLRPWKVIIPQLFSRLNHHEPYVRKSVSDLLCRLAQDRPHLVIFPAVVGAQQELKLCPATTKDVAQLEEIVNEKPANTTLSNSFSSLLQTLSQQAPETVLHVQLLVKELKRISLLWEEHWIHSLTQLSSDYAPLFSALELAAKKSPDLAQLKPHYDILINYLVADLQKIALVSQKEAETNYERNFQERYNQFISSTISKLQKLLVDWSKPTEAWLRIKQLYGAFQQRALRVSTSTMKIYDLSPVLANMHNTTISMPGVDINEMNSVCIKSVESTVYVLPTKTKPKKLAFFGNDGRKYTYLFKGLEDLHLDERIMQFLSISNSMMARTNDPQCTTDCFKAHHYSVIPLGPQSGLISWVDGVTPLFAIYKKWQQRDAALKQQQKERSVATNVNQTAEQLSMPAAIRPSELFYNKLTPLLAEQNIRVTDPRKQWPLATLRRVLEELSKETPRDLISKELWCNAVNAAQWRKSVRSYAISVAVMSVIGYVIGLGDRHLDNMLIKLSTGEILHIDYNVCFEKGKTLRVPEKVPFRMTPNLEEALGITGIEGTFRLGCEHVLKTLRKERETLLTLLEAFVYDPLVDWTVSDDSNSATTVRTTSAQMAAQRINALNLPAISANAETVRANRPDELVQRKQDWESTRQNIRTKFNEIKPYWTKYKDEVHAKLLEINKEVEYLLANRLTIKQAEQERANLTKQLAMIHELEALGTARGSHALNTITQRYTFYKSAAVAFNGVKQSVQKYHSDIKRLMETYLKHLIVAPLAANELLQLQMELRDQQQSVHVNEFVVVCNFLEQSGQEQLYEECDFTRKEMENSIYQETRAAMDCLKSLLQYASVMQYYPRSLLQRNHLVRYEQWYWQLLDEEQDAASLIQQVEQWFQSKAEVHELKMTVAQQYSSEMEEMLMNLNFELHQAVNELNERKQQETLSIDVAVGALETFLASAPELNAEALHLSLLHTLAQANGSFQRFEEAAVASMDCHQLEQQIDYIDVWQRICRSVFKAALPQESFAALQVLSSTLLSLQRLKSAFELPILERLLHLYMLDNDLELQATLNVMCTSPTSARALLQAPNDGLNVELRALLTHVFELFEDFEQKLQELQYTARNFGTLTHKDDFNPYVNLKIRKSNLQLFVGTTKFETVAQVFRMARDFVAALNESSIELVYDVRLLSAPVAEYIHYMQKYLLSGLTSLFATFLHNNLNEAHCSVSSIDDATLSSARALTENLLAALQHNASLKNCELQVQLHTKWVDHYTLVASAHFWANEEQMVRDNPTLYKHIVCKEKLLSSVQNASQSLNAWKQTLTKIQCEIEDHTTNILQRLGCLADSCQQSTFAEHSNAQRLRYQFHLQLVTKLLEYANVLLQFEVLCGGSNAFEADNAFLAIVAQWQETYTNWRQSGAVITPVEQDIVQLLDPEGKVDQCWIENISGLLDDMTFNVHRELVTLEHTEQLRRESLCVNAKQIQPFIDAQMRIDVRHLLKMVAKNDKSVASTAVEAQRVRELQQGLKLFYAKLNELQLQLTSRDFADAALCQIKNTISELLNVNTQMHNELLQLVQRVLQADASLGAGGSCASSGDNKSSNPPNAGASSTMGEKKVAANQSEQKRNAYAVSVWKRIRMKLEGRDPDPNCRSSVAEQVEFIIREATTPDNLAVLYEGWTPWV